MFSLKNAVAGFAQRQSFAALGARFAGQEGIAVSVLCVTRDADSYLDLFLGALENQLLPASRFEVLVFDNGSLDDTNSILARFSKRGRLNLRVESAPVAQAPAQAWNRLIERARGEVLLFGSDTLIAHPPLLVQHLMAHLEGESSLCGAPVPRVHSHLFPIELMPVSNTQPSPIVSSDEANWMEFLAPFVCSVEEATPEPASWLDFDLSHASVRRATFEKVGGFSGETFREEFGAWGLLSRDFALRAQECGVGTRWLPTPAAWGSLKPSLILDAEEAQLQLHRFFAQHPVLESPELRQQISGRFFPSALPAWSR